MEKVIVVVDGTSVVGSWRIPGGLNDRFQDQQDIGWHVCMALIRGAESVKVELRQRDWAAAP